MTPNEKGGDRQSAAEEQCNANLVPAPTPRKRFVIYHRLQVRGNLNICAHCGFIGPSSLKIFYTDPDGWSITGPPGTRWQLPCLADSHSHQIRN